MDKKIQGVPEFLVKKLPYVIVPPKSIHDKFKVQ